MARDKANEELLQYHHEVVQQGGLFRDAAKVAIGQSAGEIGALRAAHADAYRSYKESVSNHREVSIAFDELLNATLQSSARQGTETATTN